MSQFTHTYSILMKKLSEVAVHPQILVQPSIINASTDSLTILPSVAVQSLQASLDQCHVIVFTDMGS